MTRTFDEPKRTPAVAPSVATPSPMPMPLTKRPAPAAAPTFSPVYSSPPGRGLGVNTPPLDLVAQQLAAMLAAFPDGYVRVRAIWGKTPLDEVRSWAGMVQTGLMVYGVPSKRIQVETLHADLAGLADRDGQVEIGFVEKRLPSLFPPPVTLPPAEPSLFPIQPIPPAPATGGPSIGDSQLVKGVRKAVSVAFDGIGVDQSHGFAKVSVKGATVGLRQGDFSASGRLSFTGTYTIEAKYGDLHFSGSLSADRWEMSLSYPGDTSVPDGSALGEVVRKGLSSFGAVAAEAATFEGLSDVSRIADNAKPHVQPLLDAVTAAGGLMEAQRNRLNVGIGASGPGPVPVPGISPTASSINLTLTYSF